MRISLVVMAHPSRADAASRLVRQLDGTAEIVFDPDPDGPPTALRTAARAWRRCPPGSSHHLVLQDDIAVAPTLVSSVTRAVRQHPAAALALYANSTSWNGAVARVGVLAGYQWVTSVPGEWFPTQGIVLPCRAAHEFADLARRHSGDGDGLGDDTLMAGFLAQRGHTGLIRTTNLVDHIGMPSIMGNDDQGIRRSVCFEADLPADGVTGDHLAGLPAWPAFAYRRALLRMPSGHGRQRWQTRTRTEHLATVGISWPEIGTLAGKAYADLPVPPERRARCLRFLRELCLASYTLGWVVSAVPGSPASGRSPLMAAALRSYVEAGLGYQRAVDLWTDHSDLLMELARHALEAGMSRGTGLGSVG
jgi:hypothetical protein